MSDGQSQRQQAPRIEQCEFLGDHTTHALPNEMIVLPFELMVKQCEDVFGHTTGGGKFGGAITAPIAPVI